MMRFAPRVELRGTSSRPDIIPSVEATFSAYPETLSKKDRAFFRENEVKKTEDELRMFQRIDEVANVLAVRFGGTAFFFPPSHIHLIKKSAYWEKFRDHDEPVATSTRFGNIAILDETRDDLHFLAFFALKGILEQKAYRSVIDHAGKAAEQRYGLEVYPDPRKEELEGISWSYFKGVQAAIVEELTLQAYPRVLAEAREVHAFAETCDEVLKLFPPDMLHDPNDIHDTSEATKLPMPRRNAWFRLPFFHQRQVIEYVVQTLCTEQPATFPNRGAGYTAFFQAYFKGNWLPLARGIEKCFGKDTFRIIANMTRDRESAVATRNILEERRTHLHTAQLPAQAVEPSMRQSAPEALPAEMDRYLRENSLRKTPEIKRLIQRADEITADYVRSLGLEPAPITQEIHILRDRKNRFLYKSNGETSENVILIHADLVDQPAKLLGTLIHEFFHARGLNRRKGEWPHTDTIEMHSGVSFLEGAPQETQLLQGQGLNEAIVELLTQRCLRTAAHTDPSAQAHLSWLQSEEGNQKMDQYAKRYKIPGTHVFSVDYSGTHGRTFSYIYQVRALRFIIESIYHDHSDRFTSEDAVVDVFGKAHFTGNNQEIHELIEQSFGPGSFRVVASMAQASKNARPTLELLQRLRITLLQSHSTARPMSQRER